MDLALNNLQRLICHKTHQTKPIDFIYDWMYLLTISTRFIAGQYITLGSQNTNKRFVVCYKGKVSPVLHFMKYFDSKHDF